MFGIKLKSDWYLTYGQFESGRKALHFGEMEFGDLVEWAVVKVNH